MLVFNEGFSNGDSNLNLSEYLFLLSGCVYLPMESQDVNDPELSLLSDQSSSLQLQILDPERSRSLLNRLSPSRSKLMRSMRRKSGGSIKHDDNDNEIDPTKEDKECRVRLEQPVSAKSHIKIGEKSADFFPYYDVPRKLSRDSPVPTNSQLNNYVFSQVDEKPKVIKKKGRRALLD